MFSRSKIIVESKSQHVHGPDNSEFVVFNKSKISAVAEKQITNIAKHCPYGRPGDLLWVRETWAKHSTLPGAYEYLERVAGTNLQYQHKWKPSIHMPYEAARIKLIVKRVWVERLNIINWDDATAEGVEQFLDPNSPFYENYVDYTGTDLYCYSPISSYESLWTKINGPKSWASNPWVWCVEFKEFLVRI